jgi:hypothetical protein
MSHEFWPLDAIRDHFEYDASHLISHEARAFDARIFELWRAGKHAEVVELYPEYLERFHPEGRFAHYLITLGAIGGVTARAPATLLSAYENAVGTGQAHVWFDLQHQELAP